MISLNQIKEVFDGHFQLILDFQNAAILNSLLKLDSKYVWVFGHKENRNEWKPYSDSLYNKNLQELSAIVETRNISFEYLLKTENFFELIPLINQTITLYQINKKPPYYLDLNRLKGKKKYDLLKKEVDYLFEIEVPGAVDYITIVSPDKEFLKSFMLSNNLPLSFS